MRPVDASDEKDDEKGDEKSRFIYKPGVFVERVRDAIQNPHQQHVVLLDELNRSNVPRVLGDLLTTLEASKRTKRYNYPEKGENAIVVKPCKAKIMYLEYVDRKKDKLVDLKIKLLDSIDSSVQADYSLGEIRKQVTLISRTRKRAYNSLLKEL
ncbi:MAG: hypothetical protein ACKVG2_07710, partial [Candidatus Poseidoniales archaeon]